MCQLRSKCVASSIAVRKFHRTFERPICLWSTDEVQRLIEFLRRGGGGEAKKFVYVYLNACDFFVHGLFCNDMRECSSFFFVFLMSLASQLLT